MKNLKYPHCESEKIIKKSLMKSIIFLTIFISSFVFADVYVRGYYRSNGTYVQGHYRSSPDSSNSNNWSSYGNTNPYTGKKGYKKYNSSSSPYSKEYFSRSKSKQKILK